MGSCFTNQNIILPITGHLSILIAAVLAAGEPPSVVPSACNRAYAVGSGSFTVDFCLSALNGHSAGAADNADLALITVDLATANATATLATIGAQLSSGSGALADGLRVCQSLYDAVVHRYQPDCHAAVKEGRCSDGKVCPRKTVQVAGECEWWFEQRSVASPVAWEDDSLAKLTNLTIALTSIA